MADAKRATAKAPAVEEDAPVVQERREPVFYDIKTLALTSAQAAQLTRGEARLRAFTKHVNPLTLRKYGEGDRVLAVTDGTNDTAAVLPFGIEVALTPEEG